MALNPYEFWRAQKSRVAICANPMPTRCPLFSLIEATFLDHSPPPPPPLTRRKGVDTKKTPVPIGLWDQLKSFAIMKLLSKTSLCQIVRNMMKNLCASFDWFSLTEFSARSIQATVFCPTNKNSIQKKPSKPIEFLMWEKKTSGWEAPRYRVSSIQFWGTFFSSSCLA